MTVPQMRYSAAGEERLMERLWDPQLVAYPYLWLREAIEWNEGELVDARDMRHWQRDLFEDLGEQYRANLQLEAQKKEPKVIRIAVRSGHGSGKSAWFGMFRHWYQSAFPGSTIIVAANKDQQLRKFTFPEAEKWGSCSINAHWFHHEGVTVKPAPWFEEALQRTKRHTKHYYTAGQLWDESKPEGFAGCHNGAGVCAFFDESSGIPEIIWESVEKGYFTERTPNRFFIVAGNPLRSSGAFFQCFHRHRAKWTRRTINCLDVEGLAHDEMRATIAEDGWNSTTVRTRIRGLHPEQESDQWISRRDAEAAATREVPVDAGAPLITGVDVAREGEDDSVIAHRQGKDARSRPWQKRHGFDGPELASLAMYEIEQHGSDALAVDGNGFGASVTDHLKLAKCKHTSVMWSEDVTDDRYYDRRSELWGLLKDWLKSGGAIPDDPDLLDDLAAPHFKIMSGGDNEGKIKIESVESMKKRGLASPDRATALLLTLAVKVMRRDSKNRARGNAGRKVKGADYLPCRARRR